MKRKRSALNAGEAHLVRLAWWASFFATVALIAVLGLARSAQAMTVTTSNLATSPLNLGSPAKEESEAEEEELEAGECEAAEEEFEAEEQEECEAEAEAEEEAEAVRECILSSADATVSTAPGSDKVRLAIRYTAYSPAALQVVSFLRGSKGPVSLGSENNHLGKKGVIHDTDTLTPAQMSKALAARSFTIELRPANAPRFCHSLLDRHLTVRRSTSGRLTWSDPGPASTASRVG